MNDAEFRKTVERDARRAGMPAEVAAALARHVGKRPPAGVAAPTHRAVATRAQGAPRVPSTRDGRIDALCRLYGAAALAPDFKAHRGTPLRAFAALLDEAAGSRAKITPAGVTHVRMALMAAARGAA